MIFIVSILTFTVGLSAIAYTDYSYRPEKYNALFWWLMIGLYLLLVYFRPLLFADTANYLNYYNKISWDTMKSINLLHRAPEINMEYGFIFYLLLFKSLGLNFRFASAVISLFSIASLYYFCSSADNYRKQLHLKEGYLIFYVGSMGVPFVLMLYYFGIFYNMMTVRGWFSMIFILWSAHFALKKKDIRGILFFVIAFSIQRLSVLGLVPLFIFRFIHVKIKKWAFLLIWMICGVLILVAYRTQLIYRLIWPLVGKLVGNYINFAKFQDLSSFSISKLVLFFGYWIVGMIMLLGYEEQEIFSKYVLTYICVLLGAIILSGFAEARRLLDYLYVFTIPILYRIFIRWKKGRWLRALLFFVVSMVFLILMARNMILWNKDYGGMDLEEVLRIIPLINAKRP